MLHEIYFTSLVVVTIIVVYLYISSEYEHKKELTKIEKLEEVRTRRQRELDIIRTQTDPCSIHGLNDPRSCYFDSGFQCSWNQMAERCDKKK